MCIRDRLIDDEIFTKPEGAFRRDFEDHFYRMASEIFWGAEGLLLASSAPRYLTERSERRIEEEDALLRKIQNAIREADGEELRAAFEELTLSVEERRLHLEMCIRDRFISAHRALRSVARPFPFASPLAMGTVFTCLLYTSRRFILWVWTWVRTEARSAVREGFGRNSGASG